MARAAPAPTPWRRRIAIAMAILVALPLLAILAIGAFPGGLLRTAAEHELAARFGRPVTIGAVTRIDRFGFTPTIAARDVRVAQAPWAGTGTFATLHELRATFSIWALLRGRFDAHDVTIDGLRLALVRGADGRTNWSRPGARGRSENDAATIGALTIRDAIVSYRDALRDRNIVATVSSDSLHGVAARGTGAVHGTPVNLTFTAPPVTDVRGKPWPFTAAIDGAALSMHARGTMDRALDTNAMTLDVTARARDLMLIDAVIEAGLFPSQPVALAAHVRHDAPRWTVDSLHGTIGRSDLDGRVAIDRAHGRTRIDGQLTMRQLDFDDLSSTQGLARGAAMARAIGPRVVPDTRIDLAALGNTDGTIRFAAQHIVSRNGPSVLTAATGTATLDHRVLTLRPLTLWLPSGTATGSLRVEQRDRRPPPLFTADLLLKGSSLRALGASGNGAFTGGVTMRARLRGKGETIRAAVGASDGTIGFVVRDGSLPVQTAEALGFDAGRALLAGRDDRAQLRCVVARLRVAHGVGRTDPLIVDTSESQMQGEGTLTFPSEQFAVRLTGAPKRDAVLKLPGVAYLEGTLSQPQVRIPPEVKSIGNIFKAIGRAIKGTQGPLADDADCGALAAMALR